jgi:hypothetical protein
MHLEDIMATVAIRTTGVRIAPGVTRDIPQDQPHEEAHRMVHTTTPLNQVPLIVVDEKAQNFLTREFIQDLFLFS